MGYFIIASVLRLMQYVPNSNASYNNPSIYIKLILNITLRLIAGLIIIVLLYLSLAWLLSRVTVPAENEKGNDVHIYLMTNGVHTDIGVPINTRYMNWQQEISYQDTRGKDSSAKYVAFGWGDKGFYMETPTWAELKFSVACRAAFGYGSSAVHATFYRTLAENNSCIKISLSNAQYRRLANYILETLVSNAGSRAVNIPTKAFYGNNDAFYEAKGRYSILYTCNTWTNNALKSCGQTACLWTPFDTGIFYQYDRKVRK